MEVFYAFDGCMWKEKAYEEEILGENSILYFPLVFKNTFYSFDNFYFGISCINRKNKNR